MAFDDLLLPALCDVEDLDVIFDASCKEPIAVQTEFNTGQGILCYESTHLFFGTGLPHFNRGIV